MRMVTAVRTGMLALLVAVPAAAQAPRQDAGSIARAFIGAINEHRWADAAAMVLPAAAEPYHNQQVSTVIQRAEQLARDSTTRSFYIMPCDTIDTRKLAVFASARLMMFPGAQTLGEAASMPPRVFMARTLERRFSTMPREPGVQILDVAMPRYVGVFVENDSLAHALYRYFSNEVRFDDSVETLILRRLDGRWYVAPEGKLLWSGSPALAAEPQFRH